MKKLIDTARAIEGMPRNTSTHAAGVVITSRPVSDYVPLAKNDDLVVTQYIMTTLEELGLLKMDFLGLRNLTILDDTVRLCRRAAPASLWQTSRTTTRRCSRCSPRAGPPACSRWSPRA